MVDVDNIIMRLETSARKNWLEATLQLRADLFPTVPGVESFPEPSGHRGCNGDHRQGGEPEFQAHRHAGSAPAGTGIAGESRRLCGWQRRSNTDFFLSAFVAFHVLMDYNQYKMSLQGYRSLFRPEMCREGFATLLAMADMMLVWGLQ